MQSVLFLTLMLMALPASAQSLQFGLKTGVPITEYFDTGATGGLHENAHYTASTRRYTLGASIEWRFAKSFGLEFDTMFHRMGYVAYVNTFSIGYFRNSAVDVIGDSWDFPLAVKYRLPRARRAFILGGGVLRYIGPVRGRGQEVDGFVTPITTVAIDTTEPSELRKRFYPGVTLGAGVECPLGPLHIVPEFRYVRWTANIAGEGGVLRFSPNQAEVMVGFVFGRRK
jgi:hypothetical protein